MASEKRIPQATLPHHCSSLHLPRNPEDADEGARALKGKMVNRFVATELRQKRKLMGHLGAPGKEEVYCDKDRAAAVAMGDQDIKTSLKVKRKKERRVVQPEDTYSSVHLTEAQRAITMGRVETALSCAQKAVESGGDPASLVVRGRCHLLLGHLQEALEDARGALKMDPSLVKAVLVQAEALYGMGEFERSLVLFHRGARRRPDLTSFTRGVHKAREAIVNAIGGDSFPDAEEPVTGTSLTEGSGTSGQSQTTTVPTISFTDAKEAKSASKRLLGGLSKDKEFLASLVGRRSLHREVVTADGTSSETHPGRQVAAVAKEALSSLQIRFGGPKSSLRESLAPCGTDRDVDAARANSGMVDIVGGDTVMQDVVTVEVKPGARCDVEAVLREAEELLAEVKGAGVGGRLLCRLLVGVGVALPRSDRHDDAIAVLTDAVHIARASEYGEEEHVAVEALGRTLASRGQHAEAVSVWERRIPAAKSSRQRASLFLLIAKSYFATMCRINI
nr:outer dynein arm-docking complex subunit 4-like [Procambarus clarkii]